MRRPPALAAPPTPRRAADECIFSVILLAGIVGLLIFLLSRREAGRRSQYGPAALNEFRTALPLDECFDRLEQHSPEDVFAYECRRENDGGFMLHFTLHQPTRQPLDTLYTLRLDPGRETVATLFFYPGSIWL